MAETKKKEVKKETGLAIRHKKVRYYCLFMLKWKKISNLVFFFIFFILI